MSAVSEPSTTPSVAETPVLPDAVTLLPTTEVAEILSIPRTRVHQLIKDGHLLSLRHEGTTCVPADFLDGDVVVKGLAGTITVLRDGGYADEDILRWLFEEDDSLPGTPIASMRAGRHREIKRRAQAMAL
ncbi:Rv2175c family DNA-binding protein [Pseudonocardia ailaonensis]|uniref:Rv2175c family DNA-binding protein n=1 Tax=Pseudonocardia ailaonensis TaxID=367279 RepID=A0ABN2MU43_9PSEU